MSRKFKLLLALSVALLAYRMVRSPGHTVQVEYEADE